MRKVILADGTEIANYTKPYIIAEVNSSHNGSVEVARKMIDAAVDAGCDCVKFQSWTAKSLYSKSYYLQNPIAKRFVDKLSLSTEELKEMALYCCEKNIGFSSTPYSMSEVDFLVQECNVPFIKISSMEINNPQYIRYIAEKNIPIVISTGMSDYEEIKKAVAVIEQTGNRKIILLHCVSVYPTPIDKANLNNIRALQKMFSNYPIGYSDHTLGDAASVIATTMGAAVLEKHITLDAKKIGMDNQMAMEPYDLKQLVYKCKSVSMSLGTEERNLQPEEIKQRVNMRRSVVVTRNLKAGEVIKEGDLDVKRPGTGIEPRFMSNYIGYTVNRDIEEDTLLRESDVNMY